MTMLSTALVWNTEDSSPHPVFTGTGGTQIKRDVDSDSLYHWQIPEVGSLDSWFSPIPAQGGDGQTEATAGPLYRHSSGVGTEIGKLVLNIDDEWDMRSGRRKSMRYGVCCHAGDRVTQSNELRVVEVEFWSRLWYTWCDRIIEGTSVKRVTRKRRDWRWLPLDGSQIERAKVQEEAPDKDFMALIEDVADADWVVEVITGGV